MEEVMDRESPIVAFLRARLDEDEQIARAASEEDWTNEYGEFQSRGGEDFDHILRHSPSRVLREVESKRRILDEIVPVLDDMEERIDGEWGTGRDPLVESDNLLRLLALPYVDHPDYSSAVTPVTP